MSPADEHREKTPQKPIVMTGNSVLVPAGSFIAILLLFLTGWRYLDSRFAVLSDQITALSYRVTALEQAVDNRFNEIQRAIDTQWSRQDMRVWEQELKIKNPSLDVPDSTRVVGARTSPR